MFRTFAVASLGVAAVTATSTLPENMSPREEVEYLFETWRRTYKMEFETPEEHIKRLNIFAANHVLIMEHNNSGSTYTMDHNQFSHLTAEEFAEQNIRGLAPETLPVGQKHEFDLDMSAAPDAVDWTEKGAVTDVKNQGQCGSCWSFSTTGSLEGRYFLESGNLHVLSEQELVDCDGNDAGCNGGLMDNAFDYAEKHGLASEASYGYHGSVGRCTSSAHSRELPAGAVKGHVDVPRANENALKAAVAEGPVSVAIEADQMAFQFYSGGVMTGNCGRRLDHGVLAVGYGTEPKRGLFSQAYDYWKVKNSWGPSWGEKGYIRIQRGAAKCGIADQASYPKF